MNKWQQQVETFHRTMGLKTADHYTPLTLRERCLRQDLIEEECNELINALAMRDDVAAVDGMCDLIYVVLGTAVSMGIDLDPYFNEVQESNMSKVGGPKAPNGKLLKPPSFKPPRIKELLEAEWTG